MLKYFFKISLIIFGNLFAFLIVGYILSVLFGIDKIVYRYLLLVSIISLIILLRMEVKSYRQNIEKIITKKKKNNGK